jgi:hypothetical protein
LAVIQRTLEEHSEKSKLRSVMSDAMPAARIEA